MATPCEHYARTEVGQRLAAIVNDRARYVEYRVFSREGFPAVMALVSLIRPELEQLRSDPKEFRAAKQYIGWAVGQVMRAHGHRVIKRRRVPGGLITLGVVWSSEPVLSMDRCGRQIGIPATVEMRTLRSSLDPAAP